MTFDLYHDLCFCSKMKILEGDLASTNAENKRKRQEVAMQAVKLLANPKVY